MHFPVSNFFSYFAIVGFPSLQISETFAFLNHPTTTALTSTNLSRSRRRHFHSINANHNHNHRHQKNIDLPPLHISKSDVIVSVEKSSRNDDNDKNNARPFHQNWWPVSAISALDNSRPNAIQVLGMNLVAVEETDGSWKVLDDRCSHRFAPLSEGRVVTISNKEQNNNNDNNANNAKGSESEILHNCIQCAYHGWEFELNKGTCTKLPQSQNKVNKARSVSTYPTQTQAGILWVWTDPDASTAHMAAQVPLPTNPLLRKTVDCLGNKCVFQRDLPYGMEILGENLLDLSHLPFAHHSVGSLKRDLGGDLPLSMQSELEREANSAWEKEYDDDYVRDEFDVVLPTFQVAVENALENDPIFKSFPSARKQQSGDSVESPWTTTISFYAPNHVRYRRIPGTAPASHVELFLCPTSEGRSRVFLVNCFDGILPSSEKAANDTTTISQRPPLHQRVFHAMKPSTIKTSIKQKIMKKVFNPNNPYMHMINHEIFDGDGIFLHKQGNRMKVANLSYKDYSTPSSADILLNAYRRYLGQAARQTKQMGLEDVANAIVGENNYGNDLSRSVMLDRYNTHTKNCPVCRNALKKKRKQKGRVAVLQTALQGSVGASTLALAVSLVSPIDICKVPSTRLASAMAAVITVTASWMTGKYIGKLEKDIEKFIFQDYIHAEKD